MITYTQFASRISFFEFIQDEFFPPHIKLDKYKDEIEALKNIDSVEDIMKVIEKLPRSFDLFEELFQLKRFTNTQYTHFLFDVTKLNNSDLLFLEKHATESMFIYENSIKNELFYKLCGDIKDNNLEEKIMVIKRAVVRYTEEILKNIKGREFLYRHLINSIGTRYRIAVYFSENLNAIKHLKSINLNNFFSLKRIPRDGKAIHGKYGSMRIKKILDENSIPCVNDRLDEKVLNPLASNIEIKGWTYVFEKYIDGISKRKDGKLKKFDFIILKDGVPQYCIETNFYSTTGTKIGINIGEYTDLKEDINNFNDKNSTNLKFMWVTDGNHWLSKEGEGGFSEIKTRFFNNDWELLNYNLVFEILPKLLE